MKSQKCLISCLVILAFSTPVAWSVIRRSESDTAATHKNEVDPATKTRIHESYGKLPLSFIKNDGQLDKRVKFYERGAGHTTFFTKEGVYLLLTKTLKSEEKSKKSRALVRKRIRNRKRQKAEPPKRKSQLVKLFPVGANQNPEIIAEDLQKSKVNYFIGKKENWRTNIPTFKAVRYKSVYPGIDMKFYGNNREFEYDIIVEPGSDPAQVKLSYQGIDKLKTAKSGDLEIILKSGEKILQKKPYVYQEINGKRVEIKGKFKIEELPVNSYSFEIASYNKEYPLVIDPVLVYSTYLGGGGTDFGYGIAVDASGNAYVTGETYSSDFPTVSPIKGGLSGSSDFFVSKLNSSGSALVYSTYLGGGGWEWGSGIAVDASGNAYVTGKTDSSDFPTVSPIQGDLSGEVDAFVSKLNSEGSVLVYSTYLGGNGNDYGHGIAVDDSGNAYVTGLTYSSDFPTVSPIQGDLSGWSDAFVSKLNSEGSALVYSTYLGGSGGEEDFVSGTAAGPPGFGRDWGSGIAVNFFFGFGEDWGSDIAVDASGNAYVTGGTFSSDFPTVFPIQGSLPGWVAAFVSKLNSEGSALVYSTYLGGDSQDLGFGIAVDASGNAYVTGGTDSSDFPTVFPIQGSLSSGPDAFVSKLNSSGSALAYSTYLGGDSMDIGFGIAVDAFGNAHVTGVTDSSDFPTVFPIQGSLSAGQDAFVSRLNSSGSALDYSTYLGGGGMEGDFVAMPLPPGSGMDWGFGIAVDASGNAYVTGETDSSDFPTVSPIQGDRPYSDAFVSKISACLDADGDTYYDQAACGGALIDCDDNDASVYPGATETCNGVDDDCDGQVDESVCSTSLASGGGEVDCSVANGNRPLTLSGALNLLILVLPLGVIAFRKRYYHK